MNDLKSPNKGVSLRHKCWRPAFFCIMHEKEKNMNRSQRCGQCRGCTAKPCGVCVYCQDSPQFGGPGVKKQSCLERRCYRVLENRLQRDGPSFKAKMGCSNCEECQVADCQTCLVCLDRKFFDNRYLPGAMCAKKRCTQARSLDFPFPNAPVSNGAVAATPNGQNGLDFMQTPSPAGPTGPHGVVMDGGVFSTIFKGQGTQNPQQQPGKRQSPSSKSDDKPVKPRKKRSATSAPAANPAPSAVAPPPTALQQPATAVAITHHPIIQIQNPGYEQVVSNNCVTAAAGPPPAAAPPQFSAQIASVPPQPQVFSAPQNGPTTTYIAYSSVPSRGGEFTQAPLQLENHLMGGPNQPQVQIQSFNSAVQSSLKQVVPASLNTSASAQITVIPTDMPLYNGNNSLPQQQTPTNNGHYFHSSSTMFNGTKAGDQNGHNQMTVGQPTPSQFQYRPLPAEAVTHLCPSTFGQSGIAAFHGDSFCTDPATLIPPSFSGTHQVVLQPL